MSGHGQVGGRLIAPDARDLNFLMGPRLELTRDRAFPIGLPADGMLRHYLPGRLLDQGKTGTCVAHGWTGLAHSSPIRQKLPWSPFDFYRRIVLVDEWRENDAEATAPDHQLQSGTSVRAGAKVLQSSGYISEYLWARSASDVRAWHLTGNGGVVLGLWWYTGMFTTDSDGFISATGQKEGGHCVVTTGWNDRVTRNGRLVRACRIQNSWGTSWGQGGRCWITFDDLHKLIADQGEACAPVETKGAK